MSEKSIKIKMSDVAPGSPFMQALIHVCDQSFGGRQDGKLYSLYSKASKKSKEWVERRNKLVKAYGKVDLETGDWKIAKTNTESIEAFHRDLEELNSEEVSLPIEEPIQITRRKAHNLPTSIAGLLSDVIDVQWGDDDGEHLDKEKK
jgi:rRNA maturation endonuclease Nob1